jgi:hypothetical protein
MRYVRNRIGSCEARWVSKKFRMLDVVASSHGPRAMGVTVTRAARVPAFNNLSNDSSLDVRNTPSPERMREKHASLPPSVSGEFLLCSFMLFTAGPDN